MVADFAFGSGGGIRAIQRGLQLDADGVFGPATRTAISVMGPMAFVLNCYRWRIAYYDACGFRDLWPGLYRRAVGLPAARLQTDGPTGAAARNRGRAGANVQHAECRQIR